MPTNNSGIIDFDINQLKTFVGFDGIFHDDIIKQHGYFYIYNRSTSFDKIVECGKEFYLPLNEANLKLGRFCKQNINKLDSQNAIDINRLVTLIEDWQRLYNKGGVYDTYKYAVEIFELLNRNGLNVEKKILGSDELLDSFIQIPEQIKVQFHLGVVVKEEKFKDFFKWVFGRISHHPNLIRLIKEIKISEMSYRVDSKLGNCRNVRFLLDPLYIFGHSDFNLKNMIRFIVNAPGGVHPKRPVQFSHMEDHISVTQGNINYKKFLQLLGIIDRVYLKRYNYAFCIDG